VRLSGSSFIDGIHNAVRGRLVHHVADTLQRMKGALRNVAMKMDGLSSNVDQLIVLAALTWAS